ncbi:serine protein kinase [Podospora didyma]|uniref:non-specific serine/threonine protein kinase n=1 Tax=Podospora didyma TaxID=330526 RepID=A0AAE0N6K2_9PEZI|nr:serine protein kinase [Podospora didyma]
MPCYNSVPENRAVRRFKTITSPCEWVEDYRPGSCHPVHLGDVFNNGQHKVIRKLGHGSLSTVWLARDLRYNRYVALKILVSNVSASRNELQILGHIARVAPVEGMKYITQLLYEFEHVGPNGTHKCLVFEPRGPSVNTMVEELPQFNPRTGGMNVRYPPLMAKAILKQAAKALEFLHNNGIVHGDFQPGNMLFPLLDGGIESMSEDVLRQAEDEEARSISPPVRRKDGKKDMWAPRYLCVAQPMTPFTNYGESCKIKLCDMGSAYLLTDRPAKPVTPRGLGAPELVLTGPVDETLDIWSFACLVFELVTGRPLFYIPGYGDEEDEKDQYLLAITAQLGALPDGIFQNWKRSSLYFTPEKKLFNCEPGGMPEGEEPYIREQTSMEEMFDKAAPDLDEDEARKVKALIRRTLQYDPVKRPLPAEILLDPWFGETE